MTKPPTLKRDERENITYLLRKSGIVPRVINSYLERLRKEILANLAQILMYFGTDKENQYTDEEREHFLFVAKWLGKERKH